MATVGDILIAENTAEKYLTLGQAVLRGARFLSAAGIESARLDAEVLLRHVLGLQSEQFYLSTERRLGEEEQAGFVIALRRRSEHEPMAYITGRKEFWSRDFLVAPAVLIPRPETEILVEVGLEIARRAQVESGLRIIDVGTGSGAVAVTLAKELPQAEIAATDISAAALQIARENAERHGVADKIRFLEGDLFGALGKEGSIFHLVVCNPPYVGKADLAALPPEIRSWEPTAALDGGIDGLDYYRRLVAEAHRHLAVGGHAVLEIGAEMAGDVSRLFDEADCYAAVSVYQDYAGNDRVISARKVLRGTGDG